MSEILDDVIHDLFGREKKGLQEYKTTMDRNDLSELEWLNHAYEEALDLSLYLKKLIKIKHYENAKELE